jgi:DNA polymerase-3 subunit delta
MLEGGPRGGVFYLHGDDGFQKAQAARALVEAHLDPGTADFNYDRLAGSELDVQALASILATPPMMAEWRVVEIREVEALAGQPSAREVLLGVAESPPPGLALVLLATVPQGSKAKFYSSLKKTAQSIEFRAISQEDAPGWLMGYARDRFAVEMEPDAAVAVAGAIGSDLGMLANELEKLVAVAGEGEPVTLEVARTAGVHLAQVDRWRWIDRVGRKEFLGALGDLDGLMAQGESGVGLVIGLATHLLRVGLAAEGGAGALERALPAHQRWLAGKIAPQGRLWSPPEVELALLDLEEVDRNLKRSAVKDEEILRAWLLILVAREQGVSA